MKKNEILTNLLSSVLGCGYLDIQILEGVEYDWDDIIDTLKDNGMELNVNTLMNEVFEVGKTEISSYILDRLEELEELEEKSEGEEEEYKKLLELDVYEDIESFHNYIDTSIYFVKNGEIYTEYLMEQLDYFEEMTGFRID